MSPPGRNDPCPCGSGKKYTKCCLGKGAAVPFTPADRGAALARLADFSSRAEFDEERLEANAAFWASWLDAHGEEEGRRAMEREEGGLWEARRRL